MPPKPQDGYNPVPTVSPEVSSGNDYFSTRATPEDFGAQTGAALQKLGGTAGELSQKGLDLGIHFAQIATEAKVSDVYANQYAPAAADLRANYDKLNDADKVQGYDSYISGLKDLNKQFVGDQGSQYGQQILGQLIGRHISGEIDGAKREMVQATMQYKAQGDNSLMEANNQEAASVYNDPARVNQLNLMNHATIVKSAIDNGTDINTPEGQASIAEQQRIATGAMSVGMISRSLASGDAVSANKIRQAYAPMIPGYQQLYVDGVLHTENTRQSSVQGNTAMKAGEPSPELVGYPSSQIRATVADTAHASGIDPNEALTVLQIESAGGQQLGSRGTLGQDTASAGKSVAEQAKALCDNYNAAKVKATDFLGRPAQPWEAYTVYQQGVAGGPALLGADPKSKAVDILAPLYSNRAKALSAIQDNGGNASMSVADFLGHEQQVWTQKAKEAGCNFSSTTTPGAQILVPHQTSGETVQPSATPMQALENWNKVYPGYRDQVADVPLGPLRDAREKLLQEDNQRYNQQAEAYKTNLRTEVEKTITNPGFTDPAQLPLEQRTAAAEIYGLPEHIEHTADYNRSKALGVNGKKYSPGYVSAEDRILLPRSDPQAITDSSQLWGLVKSGDINKEDWKDLSDTITQIQDPKGQAEISQKSSAMNYVLDNIMPAKTRALGFATPEMSTRLQNARIAMQQADEDAIKEGRTAAQRYSPDSTYYIGNAAKNFIPTTAQKINAARTTPPPAGTVDDPVTIKAIDTDKANLVDIKAALAAKKITRATAESIAAKHNLIRVNQ